MSKSYKKFPLFRDYLWGRNSMKHGKIHSNRRIRRKLKDPEVDAGNGRYVLKAYGYDKWEIYEYASYKTKEDVIAEWEEEQSWRANNINAYLWKSKHWDMTLEEKLIEWEKYYKNK